jgi:hypothetical protein
MPVRNRCGICVEAERVTRSLAGSNAATAPRVSNGTAEVRVDQRVLRCRVMDQRCAGYQRLVERDDRRLGSNLDRDLLGEIFGLSPGFGDHRGDRLADIGDALMGEDRLRHGDIIWSIESRTDRFDIAEDGRGYDRHFRGRIHHQDTATRYRAAYKAQYAGAPRQIGGVAAAASQ